MHESTDDGVGRLPATGCGDEHLRLAQAFPLVYDELRRIAHRALLRASGGATLSTTALVNEAYVKLAGNAALALQDRTHLLALCTRAMRQIMVDHARRRHAEKRGGGGGGALPLGAIEASAGDRPEVIVALDEALTALAERDPRLVRLIEYRLFGGLDSTQAAALLGLTPRSVQREWLRARAWIGHALALEANE
ncbi:RNA polymerase sigma factor (TIGR02999 family) [Dokdonella fugitiva]|uniref:RNA polymerase sigma factor (TIGR02999 family) n=1 Tax=Dokdonella fugitiva TaxID=328517 RepID=A0A839F372_9GAMM|nr:ECF-type sigma factor [Dokdonella fugitiva]MBA8887510.1 RNA polymerase sigma factor (TIGR02999 family) [Dokdonella fugitiva]